MGVVSVSLPSDGSTGTVSQYNTPFTTIVNEFNGNIDNNNIKTGAAIDGSKFANSTVTASKLSTGAATAYVATSESTTSTTYADLTTTTDTVTVTIGSNGLALVSIYAYGLAGATANAVSSVSFAVSGATTIAAGTPASGTIEATMQQQGAATNVSYGHAATVLVTGLSAGSTTFKMKYKVSASTATFSTRRISVVPL